MARIRIALTSSFFMMIFLQPVFAFDGRVAHPVLTEEIVEFYNSQAKRKITEKELQLLKSGSIHEDDSPRWANHFFDAIHNLGLTTNYMRGKAPGGASWETAFAIGFPKPPLQSIKWAQHENTQIIYGANRTWQKAIRVYFDQQDEAFIALGHILHLLEDLGVPEHARGDGHAGAGDDPKSYYEDYANIIIQAQGGQLTIAEKLIQQKQSHYSNGSLEAIFQEFSSFTANNWFSEDTIDVKEFHEPDIEPLYIKKIKLEVNKDNVRELRDFLIFSLDSDFIKPLLVKAINKDNPIKTTNYDPIQRYWFQQAVPEIIKHGANLLNLYFAEIEKRQQDETLLSADRLRARDHRFRRILDFATYINPRTFLKIMSWRIGETALYAFTNIKLTFQSLAKNLTGNVTEVENQARPAANLTEFFSDQNNPTTSATPPTPTQPDSSDLTTDATIYEEVIQPRPDFSQLNLGLTTETAQASSLQSFRPNPKPPISENIQNQLSSTPAANQTVSTLSSTQPQQGSLVTLAASPPNPTNPAASLPNVQTFSLGGGIDPNSSPQPKPKDKCDPSNFSDKTWPKILISEFQYETTASTTDEYIELYNPNDTAVDLACFELRKYTSGSKDAPALIPQSKFEGTIVPAGFFLISHPDVMAKYQADLTYAPSYSFSQNNALLLVDPSDKITDLVGFGDNPGKILDFETAPANTGLSDNQVLERMNLTDTENNRQDFWANQPNPENSKSPSRQPRSDFLNLRNLTIQNLNSVFNEEASILTIRFQEPSLSVSTANYIFQLLFSTSTTFNTFWLNDFGATTTIPSPQFNGSTTTIQAFLSKCPIDATLYYLGLALSDQLIASNKTSFSTTTINLTNLCQGELPTKDHSQDETNQIQEGRLVISAAKIASASSTKDEYVELYNPNSFPVNLDGFSLVKVNKNNQEQTIIPVSKFKGVIQAFSFFLTANQIATLGILPDLRWAKSYDLAKDNSIKLLDKDGQAMDLVGWGGAKQFETEPFPANPGELILKRKAGVASTNKSLNASEKNYGHGFDFNNNKEDLVLGNFQPQNSDVVEIPPNYPTQLVVANQNATVTLDFISPYQYFGEGQYELRQTNQNLSDEEIKTNWSNLSNLTGEINLTNLSLRIGGYAEKFEFNGCDLSQKLQAGDWFILATIKNGGLLGASRAQLPASPNCPEPKQIANNLNLDVKHLLVQICEPILRELTLNVELGSTLNFAPGENYPNFATTTYFQLTKGQTLTHSVKYSASCNSPPNETYQYSFNADARAANSATVNLLASQYIEGGPAPHPINPAVKNFQFQLPSDIMKLTVKFEAKKQPFGFDVFREVLEISF